MNGAFCCSITDFFKELRNISSKMLPYFAVLMEQDVDVLEKKLELREAQMSYIFTNTLMKRYMVSACWVSIWDFT